APRRGSLPRAARGSGDPRGREAGRLRGAGGGTGGPAAARGSGSAAGGEDQGRPGGGPRPRALPAGLAARRGALAMPRAPAGGALGGPRLTQALEGQSLPPGLLGPRPAPALKDVNPETRRTHSVISVSLWWVFFLSALALRGVDEAPAPQEGEEVR